MADVMVTTIDNPFDPFTEFDEWNNFDTVEKGYYTKEYLDRVSYDTNEMSPEIADYLVEKAVDEIVSINALGIYKKVWRKDKS